jgi:hypothetical protein
MAGVTEARRVQDRILCGRQVAGRYVCQGEIATVAVQRGPGRSVPGPFRDYVRLPRGMFAEPGSQPVHWRQTARAARGGNVNVGPRYRMSRGTSWWSLPALPLTRDCPHCGFRNLVSDNTLTVLKS